MSDGVGELIFIIVVVAIYAVGSFLLFSAAHWFLHWFWS